MTKQKWPHKLTLSRCGSRWIKKYRQKQYYHPIPEEIRGNIKKLEKHNREAWNKWWLPLVGKIKTREVESEKAAIRDRWEARQERIPKGIFLAQRIGSKETFVNVLLGVLINEYEAHTGEDLGQTQREAIIAAPQDHPEVFGFELMPEAKRAYQLPEKRRVSVSGGDSETNIEALIVRFLEEKETEVVPRRITMLRGCLVYFQQFVNGDTEFSEITEQTLKQYRLHVLSLMSAGKFGDERAGNLVEVSKQFLRWCMAQSKLVTLLQPVVASSIHSILSSRGTLTVKKSRKEVKTLPIDEIRDFLASDDKSEINELYALLAANCAMTPVDMVDFRWTDIKKGVLTYKRHKERDKDNVPVVKYPLWSRTLELIEKQPKTDDRVLPKAASSVDGSFRYAKQKTGFRNVSLGSIKKTSSTLLGEKLGNDLADYWLGHSANTIGKRHYIKPSDANLAEAVRWLETQYFPQ